jgi:hypothetical protein
VIARFCTEDMHLHFDKLATFCLWTEVVLPPLLKKSFPQLHINTEVYRHILAMGISMCRKNWKEFFWTDGVVYIHRPCQIMIPGSVLKHILEPNLPHLHGFFFHKKYVQAIPCGIHDQRSLCTLYNAPLYYEIQTYIPKYHLNAFYFVWLLWFPRYNADG